MKILVLAPFVKTGTIHGMVEGMVAGGHQWESISTDPKEGQVKNSRFVDQVLSKYDSGSFDTILVGKGSSIALSNFKSITSRADVTYWCPDSVSGNGCGPPGRPEDVGVRGLACTRIICTGSEGCRWWRKNGFKGRIAQIYQGCRHSIWRPENLDADRVSQHQIAFLGSANYKGDGGRRAKLLALSKNGFSVRSAKRIFHEEAAKLYYDSAICLNMVCGTPGEGHAPVGITSNRLVRLLTSGGFALTERNTDVEASFEDGNQLAMFNFHDIPDLLERARYYMDNPKERLEIARRGWEWSANWSWDQQMEKMMRFIDGDDVSADGAASPWVGTLLDG
jgi:hypothetical protein